LPTPLPATRSAPPRLEEDEEGGAFAARLAAAAGPAEAARFAVEPVAGLPGTVLIRAKPSSPTTPPPPPPVVVGAVVVSRAAGEAVLLGAPAFAPGVLATTAGLGPGEAVELRAVTAVKGGPPGLTRGCVLPDLATARAAAPVLLGVGTLLQARAALFAGPGRGPAVRLTHPVHPAPSGEDWAPPGRGAVVQHLASVAAAAALGVRPGAAVVLDCCAAPGAKATLLAAALRGGPGVVVALDKSRPRVARLAALAAETGVADVLVPVRADATRLWQLGDGERETRPDPRRAGETSTPTPPAPKAAARIARKAAMAAACGQRLSVKAAADAAAAGVEVAAEAAPSRARGSGGGGSAQPPPSPPSAAADAAAHALAAPGRFSHVLLDAPCSGLGLRPRLAQPLTAADVARAASYQRALLRQALAALAPGGTLVYSTCSLAPAENEAVVAAALASGMVDLVDAGPPGGEGPARLGGRGLVGRGPVVGSAGGGETEAWLPDEAAAGLVRRFWPGAATGQEGGDTIGFFMAKFVRRAE
jgi:16S rRNA C967 or C1407 C5-methylase (RsmB/RsmF family)